MNISELGATADMIEGMANEVPILTGGYKVLTKEEVIKILQARL